MAIKVVNNLLGLNGIILTLLVFSAYLKILPKLVNTSIIVRIIAIAKAIKEVHKIHLKRDILVALA